MVTNQPDVAKGIQHRHVVESINAFVASCLELDAVKVCWCMEGEGCECYKPRPGMLIEAAAEFGIDLAASYMIGDRWRDVGAGFNAGCKTLFIECGYEETGPYCPDATVGDLPEAVDIILSGGFR